jgi:O-antigen/teichoic acid export membrane protein
VKTVPVPSISAASGPDASPLRRLVARMGLDASGRVVAEGAVTSFLTQIAGYALGFVLQLTIARTVGVKEYGVYLYVLAWLNTALLLGKLEFDLTAIRHIGAYSALEQWSLLRGFLRRCFEIVTTASTVTALLGAGVVLLFSARFGKNISTTAMIASPLLVATAVLIVSGASLRGFGRVLEAQVPNLIFRPLLYLILLASARLVGRSLDAASAMVFNLIATLSAMLLSLNLLNRETPAAAKHASPRYEMQAWMRATFTLVLIAAFQLAVEQQSDVLVVGSIVGTTGAGLYGAASQISALVLFTSQAIAFVGSPMMSRLHARGNHDELQRLLRTIAKLNVLCGVPVALGLILLGRIGLGLYGPRFTPVYPVLVVLTVSQLVAAIVGGTAGTLLTMTGRQNAAARFIGISAVVNIALTIPLTYQFGLIGTAVATLSATCVRALMLERYCRKTLDLHIVGRARRAS